MNEKICIPIDSEIVGEMFLRSGPKVCVSGWIEAIVQDYLDRTADDGCWDESFEAYRASKLLGGDFEAKFGDPKGGCHWPPLFLPNGTSISMEYKRETYHATVKFGKIDYDGANYTPSELARVIASNTSRNAWRDLRIKRPEDSDWTLADDLRRQRERGGQP